MELLRVIWLFVLEGIREKQFFQSILQLFSVIGMIPGLLGFREGSSWLAIQDPVLHRISSPAHSATTDIEIKTMKSLLRCPAHGEASPCSRLFLPLPPLPFAQPHVPRWFLLHSSFCSFKSNYTGNVSDANLFKPEHTVKSAL